MERKCFDNGIYYLVDEKKPGTRLCYQCLKPLLDDVAYPFCSSCRFLLNFFAVSVKDPSNKQAVKVMGEYNHTLSLSQISVLCDLEPMVAECGSDNVPEELIG